MFFFYVKMFHDFSASSRACVSMTVRSVSKRCNILPVIRNTRSFDFVIEDISEFWISLNPFSY